jgi:hypothetical protein
VKTEGLVEVVTMPLGPRGATDAWSYPDLVDLRAADTGIAIAGWVGGPSKTAIQTPGGVETKSVPTMLSPRGRAYPDRNGACGGVHEYLRHDAGSQRDA